jgi:hypothetical protein
MLSLERFRQGRAGGYSAGCGGISRSTRPSNIRVAACSTSTFPMICAHADA